MPRGLPISTFVDITTAIAAGGVLRTEFGTGLLITQDPAIAAGGPGKARVFGDIEGVNAAISAGAAQRAALIWFSAEPAPKSLYIGRWAEINVSSVVRGGSPATVALIGQTNASFTVDGEEVIVDLSSATTYAAIAAAIQAAMVSGEVESATVTVGGTSYVAASTIATFSGGGAGRQATADVTVVNDAVTGLVITDPGTGYTSAPTIAITDPGGGTGATADAVLGAVTSSLAGVTFEYHQDAFLMTLANAADVGFFEASPTGINISNLLGMTAGSGGLYYPGHDAESIIDAVGEMVALATGGAPVALMVDDDVFASTATDVRTQLAAYAQAGDYVFGLLDTTDQALVTGDDSSHVALVFERQQSRVEPFFSMPGERPDIGLLAEMSAQNLNQPASIITPHLKSIPGVRPTIITETQRRELERKRTNVYTTIGGLPSLVGGYTGKAGSWLDAVWWLLWLKNEMELNIFNAQRASRRFNTAILEDTIHQVMATAVLNGGCMPGGRVNAGVKQDIIQTTGNYDFNGILPTGYLLWVERPNIRSDLDRENRFGRFKNWIAPADAIHKVLGDIVLSG